MAVWVAQPAAFALCGVSCLVCYSMEVLVAHLGTYKAQKWPLTRPPMSSTLSLQ